MPAVLLDTARGFLAMTNIEAPAATPILLVRAARAGDGFLLDTSAAPADGLRDIAADHLSLAMEYSVLTAGTVENRRAGLPARDA